MGLHLNRTWKPSCSRKQQCGQSLAFLVKLYWIPVGFLVWCKVLIIIYKALHDMRPGSPTVSTWLSLLCPFLVEGVCSMMWLGSLLASDGERPLYGVQMGILTQGSTELQNLFLHSLKLFLTVTIFHYLVMGHMGNCAIRSMLNVAYSKNNHLMFIPNVDLSFPSENWSRLWTSRFSLVALTFHPVRIFIPWPMLYTGPQPPNHFLSSAKKPPEKMP